MSPSLRFPHLAQPGKLGAIPLKNRTIMASLTRNHSVPTNVPNQLNAEYYAQRARDGGAGLILSEGTFIAQQGTEWPHAPGIYSEEHAQGWKQVVDAVHKEGTAMVAQLWHTGRVCHPDQPEQQKSGDPVWGPSAIAARGGKHNNLPGQPGYVTPTAIPDPVKILDQYTHAAKLAKVAGFDGVELHSANGYLVDQFLSDVSNQRTDQWGGSVENRTRFGLEAAKRLIEVYGADRVGIKISPGGGYNDMYNTTPESRVETFKYYVTELNKLGLAYIQIAHYMKSGEPNNGGVPQGYDHDIFGIYPKLVTNPNTKVILNVGFTAETAEKAVAEGKAEAIVFGQAYISNPDFLRRAQEDLGFNEINWQLAYQSKGDDYAKGYTDYPFAPAVKA